MPGLVWLPRRVMVCHVRNHDVIDHDSELVHQCRRAAVRNRRRRDSGRLGDPVSKGLDERTDATGIRQRVVERQLTPPLDHALELG